MRWRRGDVSIAAKFSEATFSLTGEDEVELIEAVGGFKYLGRLLDRLDDNCPAVLHNITKAMQVRGQLGELIQREGD